MDSANMPMFVKRSICMLVSKITCRGNLAQLLSEHPSVRAFSIHPGLVPTQMANDVATGHMYIDPRMFSRYLTITQLTFTHSRAHWGIHALSIYPACRLSKRLFLYGELGCWRDGTALSRNPGKEIAQHHLHWRKTWSWRSLFWNLSWINMHTLVQIFVESI